MPQIVCSSICQRYLVLLQSRTVSSLLGASFTFPPPTAEGSSRHCNMFRGCQITSFGGWSFNPQARPGVLAEPHTTSCSLLHACVCELSACCFGRRVFLLQSFLDLWKPSPDKILLQKLSWSPCLNIIEEKLIQKSLSEMLKDWLLFCFCFREIQRL